MLVVGNADGAPRLALDLLGPPADELEKKIEQLDDRAVGARADIYGPERNRVLQRTEQE
jgi:hypothetical protein